jgi:hypothetical protein
LVGEVGQQFGREIILQNVDFTPQQFQNAYRGVADGLEFNNLSVGNTGQ